MSINLAQLKQQQLEYASRIVLQDDMTLSNVEKVAGADVGFEDGGNITRAAIVVLSYPTLELIEYHCAKLPTTIPYIPGYLSFRECPALLSAWDKVVNKPQLLLVDGQGVAHPRRLGVASHLGLLLDLPTIGVAKTKLCGEYEPLSDLQLASQPLFDKANKEQIGNVLRSKQRCNPLFISAGHRITQASALNWVKSCLLGYRLPEPTRFADAVASNKPLMQKLHNEKK